MTDYGVFANLVGTATSLVAAAGAMVMGFVKRAKWQPPEEVVPSAVSRMSSLLTVVGITLLYVFGRRWGEGVLGIIMVTLLAVALAALMTSIATNLRYSFYWPAQRLEANRRLGGSQLTAEAARIKRERALTEQQLFEDGQGDRNLVWTPASCVSVALRSTVAFIILIGAGACCLATAGTLVTLTVLKGPSGS